MLIIYFIRPVQAAILASVALILSALYLANTRSQTDDPELLMTCEMEMKDHCIERPYIGEIHFSLPIRFEEFMPELEVIICGMVPERYIFTDTSSTRSERFEIWYLPYECDWDTELDDDQRKSQMEIHDRRKKMSADYWRKTEVVEIEELGLQGLVHQKSLGGEKFFSETTVSYHTDYNGTFHDPARNITYGFSYLCIAKTRNWEQTVCTITNVAKSLRISSLVVDTP